MYSATSPANRPQSSVVRIAQTGAIIATAMLLSSCFLALAAGYTAVALNSANQTYEVSTPHPLVHGFTPSNVVAHFSKDETDKGLPTGTMKDTVSWHTFDGKSVCFDYDFNQTFDPTGQSEAPYSDPSKLKMEFYTEGDKDTEHPVEFRDVQREENEVIAKRWPHQERSGSVSKCWPSENNCREVRTEPTYTTIRRRTAVTHVRGHGTVCAPATAITKKTKAIGVRMSKSIASVSYQWNLTQGQKQAQRR